MNAIDTAFALVIVGLLGCIAFFIWLAGRALWNGAHPNEASMCTPSRRANITASPPPAPPGALPPAGVSQRPRELASWVADYAVPTPDGVDAIRANSRSYNLAALTAPAVPELPRVAPVEVPIEPQKEYGIPVDWPTRVVQPVPLS